MRAPSYLLRIMSKSANGDSLIDVLFVVVAHSLIFDIAGPAEAFRLANLCRAERNQVPRFRLRFAGPEPQATTSVGLVLTKLEPLPDVLTVPTWVVVAGQPSARLTQTNAAVVKAAQWLGSMLKGHLISATTPHRLIAICSGTLLAARAGLVDGRQCTTHHDLLEALRTIAPRAHVLENRVFVVDGAMASSAGISAGVDLALHLIARECGEALAAKVAEQMVVYLRRSEDDPELSPFLANRRHLHAAVHRVQDAVSAEPERNWTMAAMAAVGHVTQRHLSRLFRRYADISPLRYLQVIRLARARQSIEHGASIARAAETAGFGSALQLRRTWSRIWGGSPRDAERRLTSA
jgi:transcriptional regulator GlxA family with amidase domain